MPRPDVSEETIDALNRFCKPAFQVDVSEVGTEKKIQFLLQQYQRLHQELNQQKMQQQEQQSKGDQLISDMDI